MLRIKREKADILIRTMMHPDPLNKLLDEVLFLDVTKSEGHFDVIFHDLVRHDNTEIIIDDDTSISGIEAEGSFMCRLRF